MEPAEAAEAHPAAGVVLFDATSTPMQATTTDSTPPHFNLPVASGAIDGRSARRTACSMLEFNVNSLSDWPISYRRVSFAPWPPLWTR
jgi:hypothetical protein